jgi:Domain of unknown function (DUF4384)
MPRLARFRIVLMSALALVPAAAFGAPMSVEVWTDRGNDAVYQPGDLLQIKTRASADAYMLVYEIDAEGYIHLLYPAHPGATNRIEGGRTYRIPDDAASDLELVVQEPTGQGYLVAVASEVNFGPLPWYLRPYDPQAEAIGYEGQPEEEEGITSEGRIVGDPFVAMERIRRRVMADPNNVDAFATAYTTYYVHDRVRYPRYLCYDCHRPGYWSWWDGFDPYYASCSVFDFRVNWSWAWGPAYWCGSVPYYVYTVRYDCPPHYRRNGGTWYSGWNGWQTWCNLWGGPLVRHKSSPPPGYIPPQRYRDADWQSRGGPPGFLTSRVTRGNGARVSLPIGHNRPARDEGDGTRPTRSGSGLRMRQPGVTPQPARHSDGDPDAQRPRGEGDRVERDRRESGVPVRRNDGDGGRVERPRGERYSPPREQPRNDPPPPRQSRNDPPPRAERPRDEHRNDPPPKIEKPREERNDPPPKIEKPQQERQNNPPPKGNGSKGNDSGVQRGGGGRSGGKGNRG